MNFRERLLFAYKNRNPVNLDPVLWGQLASWQRRLIRTLFYVLKRLSADHFKAALPEVAEYTFVRLLILKALTRSGTVYQARLAELLRAHNTESRLTAIRNLAADLGISLPEDFEPSSEVESLSRLDAEKSAAQMCETFDYQLERELMRLERELDEAGVEGEEKAKGIRLGLILWFEPFNQRQSAVSSIYETMRPYNSQWGLEFDRNPPLKRLALVRVLPESASSIDRDTEPYCSLVSGGVYTTQELQDMGYFWPVHQQCPHYNELLPMDQQPTGFSGTRVNINGRIIVIP